MVVLQLRVWYADGTVALVNTDTTWQTGPSPILKNNIYLGETYDARLETPGWATASFNASAWASAFIAARGSSIGRCAVAGTFSRGVWKEECLYLLLPSLFICALCAQISVE